MRHIFLLTTLFFILGACKDDDTDAAETSETTSGLVSFTAQSKETIKLNGGITTECHVTFEVNNGLGSNIDRACVKYDIKATETAFQRALDVAGTQAICGRNLDISASETIVEKIPVVACEEVTHLNVVGFDCFDDAQKCSATAYSLDGNSLINIKN